MPGVAAGLAGFATLTLVAAVVPVLEAHLVAGSNRFRGIRHISVWDESADVGSAANIPHLLAEAKFREGFAYLQKYGLSFDTWLYHPQLMELVDLARAFPDTAIILDHIGGPLGIGPYAGKGEEVFREWQCGMAARAACATVVVRLGGRGGAVPGVGWHERATASS